MDYPMPQTIGIDISEATLDVYAHPAGSARLITTAHHNIPSSKSEDLHSFSNSRVCRPFFHPIALGTAP